jgi:hypothetical protein
VDVAASFAGPRAFPLVGRPIPSKNFNDFDLPQEPYCDTFASILRNYFDENENFAIFHVHLPRPISI